MVRYDTCPTPLLVRDLGEVHEFLFCFAFLASTPGVRLNRFNSKKCKTMCVEVRSISNLLVDQGGLLPVRAMECQLFM